jgi:rod shape determining protein RodA
MIRSLLYKVTQLHWFLLLTIIAIATFGTLVLFSAGSSAHDLATGLLHIDASYAIAHAIALPADAWRRAHRCAAAAQAVGGGMRIPAYVVGVIMLVMVDFGGVIVNGAERWLQVLPGFRLQPSELMKIAVPLALARYYHQSFSAGPQSASGSTSWPS